MFIDQPFDDPGEGRDLPFHQLLRGLRRALKRLLYDGIGLIDVEALAGLDADALHPRDDRLIGDVRRLQLHELCCVGEVFTGRHRVDLDLRRSLHVNRRVDLDLDRLGCLSPLGKRRDLVACLDLVNRVVVLRAVRLRTADDPDVRSRGIDALGVFRELEFLDEPISQIGPPSGRNDNEIASLCTGCAPARRGEHIRPHVEHRQQVIAAVCIGNRHDHRLLGEIKPSRGVERIEIRPNNDFHVRWGILRNVCERVHWPAKSFPRLDIAELFARYVHGDERVKIEVRVDSDRVRLLLSGGLLRFGCVYRNWC